MRKFNNKFWTNPWKQPEIDHDKREQILGKTIAIIRSSKSFILHLEKKTEKDTAKRQKALNESNLFGYGRKPKRRKLKPLRKNRKYICKRHRK